MGGKVVNIAEILGPQEADFTDYERVGEKLTEFSLGKNALDYTPISRIFMAVVNKKAVGELIMTVNTARGDAQIELLHVYEENRGHGVGSKLVRAAEAFAAVNDVTHIKLWTADFQGEGFYEKLGYAETARLPLRENHSDILYTKIMP